MEFRGCPYPIRKHPLGLLRVQTGYAQIRSDLLILLLTNPGERVMLPNYGTPLRRLVFEPNDEMLREQARDMIINSIRMWEPRITVEAIEVSTNLTDLNPNDLIQDDEHILFIMIRFFDPENIKDIQELKLEVPLAGA